MKQITIKVEKEEDVQKILDILKEVSEGENLYTVTGEKVGFWLDGEIEVKTDEI